jgi:sporulation protein YlmC with PRC-barrel domain
MLSTAASTPRKPSKCNLNYQALEKDMKLAHILTLAAIALTTPAISHAQVAGSTLIGVSVAELRDVTLGWSAKRQILGQAVYNDKDERVGSIDDIIVTGNKAVTYAIINAGGFVAMARHDVAVPVSQFKLVDSKLVLAGATREALRASPPFEYAR